MRELLKRRELHLWHRVCRAIFLGTVASDWTPGEKEG